MSNSRLSVYKKNQTDKQNKVIKHIPFNIPKLNQYIPGFIPGILYKITSHTGNGKTQFAKYLVFSSIAEAYMSKKKMKCLYIALEESIEEFDDSLYLFVMNVILKIPISYYDLLGYSSNFLTEYQLSGLAKAESIVNAMKEYVTVVDDVYSSSDIFDACIAFGSKYGSFDIGNTKFTTNEEHKGTTFMVFVDHISLIKDAGSSTFDSIGNWHTTLAKRVITKMWKWAVVNIQQQNLDSEKMAYNSKGEPILEKLIPSLDGLGDNRVVSRDDYIVIGIFSPARYRVATFEEYTISGNVDYALGDNLRMLYILKNRLGTPNKRLPLYFDGSCSYFCELPPSKDPSVIAGFLRNKRNEFNKNQIE